MSRHRAKRSLPRLDASGVETPAAAASIRPPEVAVAVALAALLVGVGASAAAPLPVVLMLERAVPHKGVPVEHLKERDKARHARRGLLGEAPAIAGIVDFPVEGSANP